jgi:uncharacterized protein YaaN involved in tellurite resistance
MPNRTTAEIRAWYTRFADRAKEEGYEPGGVIKETLWLLDEIDRRDADNLELSRKNDELRVEYDLCYEKLEEMTAELAQTIEAKDRDAIVLLGLYEKNKRLTELTRMHTPDEIPPIDDEEGRFTVNVLLETLDGNYFQVAYSIHDKRWYLTSGFSHTRMFHEKIRNDYVKGWYYLYGYEVDNKHE